MNINFIKLENKLKIKVKNKPLFIEALTHKSANKIINNEKLEFLGDRVIGLVLSKKLFDLYPKENEGVIDKRFAQLVNKKACSSIAWSLGLQNYVLMGNSKKKINKNDEKILSDSCEALVGSIFIDKGFDFVKKFILNVWQKNINKSHITILDSKTKLQEYSLKKYKRLPSYQFISSRGPRHNPTFKITVSIKGSRQFLGIGRSKQEAEQDGAKNLLTSINII